MIPIEVKSAVNLRAKSLRTYIDKHNPELAVRVSLADFRRNGVLIDLPLYAVGLLPGLIGRS
ncbi:MAG: hypothetical protein LBS00_04555 [Synergistaceae bacterium]|nr:hypothetical protein [Synergistaceae bacterium]